MKRTTGPVYSETHSESDVSKRILRKRNPTIHFMQDIESSGQGRGRGRGTGRGRGRPRGSKNKVDKIKIKIEPKEEIPEMKIESQSPNQEDSLVDNSTSLIFHGTTSKTDKKGGTQDVESRQSQVKTQSTSRKSAAIKSKKLIDGLAVDRKLCTAETLFEYRWPQNETNTDSYMLQEQISEYLDVTSFKRKYPDIARRVVAIKERDFLRTHKIVTETQYNRGLTALSSSDVKDIMCNDFPDKYEEYLRIVAIKREGEIKAKPNRSTSPIVRDKSTEFKRCVMQNCAKWNTNLNKERKYYRSASFDLQTNTLNYPKGRYKILPPEQTVVGHYPVAVFPGLYTDNFKRYTSDELKYLPLNTVMYGPMLPQKSDEMESDDSATDTCSSTSSSEDALSTTSRSGLEMIPDEIAFPLGRTTIAEKPKVRSTNSDPMCESCEGNALRNKDGVKEVLIHCAKCNVSNHPTCMELTLDMVPFIKKYNWHCTDCKNCIECNDPEDEDKMLFCDLCDRGYHIYCVGLRKVPKGRWHCSVCSVCHSCGAKNSSSIGDQPGEWHHEFKKRDKGGKIYLHSLCNSCHKLYKKGLYCPGCLKCHVVPDANLLLECRKCGKAFHKDCVKTPPAPSMFGFMCDPCDAKFKSRT